MNFSVTDFKVYNFKMFPALCAWVEISRKQARQLRQSSLSSYFAAIPSPLRRAIQFLRRLAALSDTQLITASADIFPWNLVR